MKLDSGIQEKDREKLAEGLSKLLADSSVLYLKTQGFHWNVEGPLFHSLHGLFLSQYTELWESMDAIAERIRALGCYSPASFKKFLELTSVSEATGKHLLAKEMIHHLILDNEALAKSARSVLFLSHSLSDEVTSELVTERMKAHEKNIWMLRSSNHD